MTNYEYKTVGPRLAPTAVDGELNKAAADGWRLVHVIQSTSSGPGPMLILEREVQAGPTELDGPIGV